MAQHPDKPEPKVSGYVDVRYKNNEPKRVEFEIEYFAGDWYTMGFNFKLDDGTAKLLWLTPPGEHYNPRQSEDARHEAIRTVSELPFVDHVEMNQ